MCESKLGKLCGDISCQCYSRSLHKWLFENNLLHTFVKFNDDNDSLYKITTKSPKTAIFYCKQCGHIYNASVKSYIDNKGCKYCTREVCGNINCMICLPKTAYSNEITKKYWNNDINGFGSECARLGSGEKYWFNCKLCNHPYATTISHFISEKGCNYCNPTGNNSLCNNMNCKQCWNASIKSHPLSENWNYELNKIDPRMVRKNTHTQYYFKCHECNNSFLISPNKLMLGCYCTCTNNTTEKWVLDFIKNKYPTLDVIKEYRFNDDKTCRFDICIPSKKKIIEIDGEQHFNQVSNWHPVRDTQFKDMYKMIICKKNGFSMMRIHQPDIRRTLLDWNKHICDFIENVNEDNDVSWCASTNIYDRYKYLYKNICNLYKLFLQVNDKDTLLLRKLMPLINITVLTKDNINKLQDKIVKIMSLLDIRNEKFSNILSIILNDFFFVKSDVLEMENCIEIRHYNDNCESYSLLKNTYNFKF